MAVELIVRVQPLHVFATGMRKPVNARGIEPARRRRRDGYRAIAGACHLLSDEAISIAGAVIDKDDLEVGIGLGHGAGEHRTQHRARVPARHNDRDQGG